MVGGLLSVEGGEEGVGEGFESGVGGGSENSEADAFRHVAEGGESKGRDEETLE